MSGWYTLLAAVAASSFACVREEAIELPDAAGARTLVVVIVQGDTTAAEVFDVARGEAIPFAVDVSKGGELWLLYYAETPAELRIGEGKLELTGTDCGRKLPAGARAFASPIGADTSRWTERDVLPGRISELRFNLGDSGSCVRFAGLGELSADIRCATAHCQARMTRDDCRLTIASGACQLDVLTGELGGNGETCFRPSETFAQCDEVDALPEAVLSLSCSRDGREVCGFDVYAPVAAPRFAVDRVKVLDVEPNILLGFERPPSGYTSDLVVLEDRIVVSTHDGRRQSWHCDTEPEDRLVFLDRETLAIIGTATVPRCLNELARDPMGAGFIGAYGGHNARIGRFDRDGRLLASTAYAGPDPSERLSATGIALGGDPPSTAGVSLTSLNAVAPFSASRIFGVDLATLTQIPPPDSPGNLTRELTRLDGSRWAAVDDIANSIVFVDIMSMISSPGPSLLGEIIESATDIGQPFYHPASDRILISLTGNGGGIFIFDGRGRTQLARVTSYERLAENWAMATWPADPELVIVGLTDLDIARVSSIALFEPSRGRFLPGSATVGQGPIGRFRPDEQGRLWTHLPRTAEVLRISAP